MRSTTFLTGLTTLSLGSGLASAACQVYGIDFQSGGSYFQNSAFTDPFTLVQEFSGCSNDTANNILVDPNGDQTECSDTPLQPDYEPETVSCSDYPKDKLYSGDWSLVVISNNGDADPVAFQRDFSLSVGTPSTTTFTPVVTQTDIETQINSVISSTTSTITTTLLPSTTIKRQLIAFGKPTLNAHPLHIKVITSNLFTVTRTQYQPQVTQTTVQATASCIAPIPNWIADPIARIEVTIIKSIFNTINSAKFKRAVSGDADAKHNFVVERAARLARSNRVGIQKRAPDVSVSTVTATTNFITSTQTQITTVTSTIPTTILSTVTSTPPTITITKALLDFAALQTAILNAMSVTITEWKIAQTTKISSVPWTITHTSTVTPVDGSVAAACTGSGGRFW